MPIESVGGVIRSGKQVVVTFEMDNGVIERLEGEFIGVGADLLDGSPILYVDEDKDTLQSVTLSSVKSIEGNADEEAV